VLKPLPPSQISKGATFLTHPFYLGKKVIPWKRRNKPNPPPAKSVNKELRIKEILENSRNQAFLRKPFGKEHPNFLGKFLMGEIKTPFN